MFEGLSGEGEVAGWRGSRVSGGNPSADGPDRVRREIPVLRCCALRSFSHLMLKQSRAISTPSDADLP